MSQPVVFYSSQSDTPNISKRDVIREAAAEAVSRIGRSMRLEDAPRLDHDTYGRSGTPAIDETIFHKIRSSAVVIADVTLVGESP